MNLSRAEASCSLDEGEHLYLLLVNSTSSCDAALLLRLICFWQKMSNINHHSSFIKQLTSMSRAYLKLWSHVWRKYRRWRRNYCSTLPVFISFPNILPFSVFLTWLCLFLLQTIWKEGAILPWTRASRVRYATLTSASCPFVKLAAHSGMQPVSPFLVFEETVELKPFSEVIVASEVHCFNLAV